MFCFSKLPYTFGALTPLSLIPVVVAKNCPPNLRSGPCIQGGGNGELSAGTIVLIVLILLLLIFSFCLCKFYQRRKKREERREAAKLEGKLVQCYLCKKDVDEESWESREHRKDCVKTNSSALKRQETPYKINCPNCGKRLRLWNQDGDAFNCRNSQCPRSNEEIFSDGRNRLNCFPCDFDLCKDCVERKLGISDPESDAAREPLLEESSERPGSSDAQELKILSTEEN